jgi:hypothetical protein
MNPIKFYRVASSLITLHDHYNIPNEAGQIKKRLLAEINYFVIDL